MSQFQHTLLVLAFAVMASFPVSAADFQVMTEAGTPPQELPPAIREALAESRLLLQTEEQTAAELWLHRDLPLEGNDSGAFGLNFGKIQVGELLGVIRLESEWNDYKNKPVSPGWYTLRYGQQPADGNHTGISVYRDYAILIPVEDDPQNDAGLDQGRLNELSQGASGTVHPAIMALFPIWDEVDKISIIKNELDQPTLVWPTGKLRIGLVLAGHGELEGY